MVGKHRPYVTAVKLVWQVAQEDPSCQRWCRTVPTTSTYGVVIQGVRLANPRSAPTHDDLSIKIERVQNQARLGHSDKCKPPALARLSISRNYDLANCNSLLTKCGLNIGFSGVKRDAAYE